jgi:serine/threonine protein kinase
VGVSICEWRRISQLYYPPRAGPIVLASLATGSKHTLPLPLMVDDWSQAVQHDVMRVYRSKRDEAHRSVTTKYTILGFISSGTYGRVYKAQSKDEEAKLHAIKKFKPDKDGDIATYTGISQSAIREIAVGILRWSRFP